MAIHKQGVAKVGQEGRAATGESAQTITARSIVLGLAMGVLVILWNTYVEYIAHTARMNITHFPIALFVPYTVLTLGNAALRRLGVGLALSGAEVLTVLAMGLVGATVPAYGLTGYLLGMMAIPYYLATPENQWANQFYQYLPEWLIPSNEGGRCGGCSRGCPARICRFPGASGSFPCWDG